MRYIVPLARLLLVALFLFSAPGHFKAQTIAYTAQQGVPFASILVPLSGLMALAGGLSVLLGWHARAGAWLLVAFLVPVTLAMHAFWAVPDPMMRMVQQAMYMKNLGLLGGALLIAYFGAGPVSVDERAQRPVEETARDSGPMRHATLSLNLSSRGGERGWRAPLTEKGGPHDPEAQGAWNRRVPARSQLRSDPLPDGELGRLALSRNPDGPATGRGADLEDRGAARARRASVSVPDR